MAKKYYRWKDENCNGINPEWVEMTGAEFLEFKRKPENKHRRFIEYIDEFSEMDTIVLEATSKSTTNGIVPTLREKEITSLIWKWAIVLQRCKKSYY